MNLEKPVHVLPDLSIYPSAPVPIDAAWTKWLGTLKAEYLSDARFVIVASEDSDVPRLGNDRDEHLDKRATSFFYSLCMWGVPDYSGAILVTGGVDATGADVRRVRDVTTMWRFIHAPRVRINEEILRLTAPLTEGVWALHHSPGSFQRLLRGFRSWVKGMMERLQPDRLHQFVRSVEGFIRSPNAATFASRCTELCPGTDPVLFREIYELRNAVEHLNDWTDVLQHIEPDKRIRHATLRAFQMEQFASFLYRQVCAEPARLAAFIDDAATSRFIRSDAANKQDLIGGIFDMNEVERQLRFMPQYPSGTA